MYRDLAIEVGGFDQRFYRVAYREDSDFLFRFCTRYGCLAKYVPEASLVHLAECSGGCESRQAAFDPLACSGSIGEHYFTLKNVGIAQALCNFAYRIVRLVVGGLQCIDPGFCRSWGSAKSSPSRQLRCRFCAGECFLRRNR